MTSFLIRPAEPDDAPDVVRLINALADYERLRGESWPREEKLRKHLADDATPKIEALVAHDIKSGRCVGFALYYFNYSTFLTNFGMFLEDLFVEEKYRGSGIGFALFNRLAVIAEKKGCMRLDWNVLDWNEPAISFYEKIGATPLTGWTTMRLDRSAIETLSNG